MGNPKALYVNAVNHRGNACFLDDPSVKAFTVEIEDDEQNGIVLAECENKGHAELLVKRYNSHAALLAACKLAMSFVTSEKNVPMRGVDAISLENHLRSAIKAGESGE